MSTRPSTIPVSVSLLMGFLNGIPADIEEQAMSDLGVELVVGGILDDVLLRRVLDGADAIVHLGARRSVACSLASRLFNVYGPGQRADHAYATVISMFVSVALAGRSLPVEGEGR